MQNKRIIARLDIKGPNLVKGIHLEGLRVLGDPRAFASHYYASGADELLYMDVVASLYGRNSLVDFVKQTASEVFIPLSVGGGLRTLHDIKEVLRAGADKVVINTAAIQDPTFIKRASQRFGASTIVVAIECIKQEDGSFGAYTNNGREFSGREVYSWAKEVEELGAGEVILTSVDREGTGKGCDLKLIEKVASQLSIPVIAHGGVGSARHASEVLKQTAACGVALASIIHYQYVKARAGLIEKSSEGNKEFLKSGAGFSKISECSIGDIKNELLASGIPCRTF